ncbi:unnamed protein product [Danaus chrysippus]|uniref:(African queen) hypothetical protein n=1 Tax=Danaus chrysippus TaxID=151541 RepID=A0A8J2RAL6_9NEOP|nr:unnamed protein product [Danaus chrysippus]
MTHAFLVVVTIAISLKLLFLMFSLFVTLTTSSETQTPGDLQTKQRKTNVMSIWKQTFSRFFSKPQCMETNNKAFSMKL